MIEVKTQKQLEEALKKSGDGWHEVVRCVGDGEFRVSDSSRVSAHGSSTVYAHGSSTVSAHDSSWVFAHDSSTVSTSGSATVYAYGSSRVKADERVAIGQRATGGDGMSLERELPTSVRKLLSDALAYIGAKEMLLIAHRTGNQTTADRALTKLDRMGDVPARIEAVLRETRDA